MVKSWFRSFFFVCSFLVLSLATASAGQVSKFTEQIMQLKACVDFSVTSWIRTEKHNERVGGAEESQHLTGLAVDVVLDDKKDKAFFLRKLDSVGYYYLDEGDHIHIGYREVEHVSSRNSDDAGISDSSRIDEDVGSAAGKREVEAPAHYASTDESSEREDRDSGNTVERIHVDPEVNSSVSGVLSDNLAQTSGTRIRYFGSLRVDRDQSGFLVFHRGSGSAEVAHDRSEHNSPDPFRHPYSERDNWAILRWEYSGT